MIYSLILSLAVATPVAAQTNAGSASNNGKRYRVRLNGVFAKVCAGQAIQFTSPSGGSGTQSPQDVVVHMDLDQASPPISRSGNSQHIEPLSIDLVKTGKHFRVVWLTTNVTTAPFDIEMKDVVVKAARVRSDGSWTMTLGWSSCTNRPKKK